MYKLKIETIDVLCKNCLTKHSVKLDYIETAELKRNIGIEYEIIYNNDVFKCVCGENIDVNLTIVEYPKGILNFIDTINRGCYIETVIDETIVEYEKNFENYNFNELMEEVEEIEKGNYGFKMCRKVVEVYLDDTKEIIIKVKEKSRIESLKKALIEFTKKYEKKSILNINNLTKSTK